MKQIYDDGGRSAAGFRGSTGDCVTRAIAIVTGIPYKDVYNKLDELSKQKGLWHSYHLEKTPYGNSYRKSSSARTGVQRKVYDEYLKSIGMKWVPTMQIGSGCKVHLKDDELPSGKIICRLSKHLTAVIDGVIYDTFDPQRGGIITEYGHGENYGEIFSKKIPERCVYGYYTF